MTSCTMSYRLESPRPRSPLPPIRTHSSPYLPSTLPSPTTLLYDLPQSSTPPSTSPPRQRSRHTPPSSRSATPAQELDQFAAHCHAWYFDQHDRAGQLMTQTLESLRPSQRAPYSRLQATIRSSYHAAITRRRKSEFMAHLSSTNPGGSLSPSSRAVPFGKAAKKERLARFNRFLKTWCTPGMPGTRPFFQGLWAVLRLQVLPVVLGGAGPKRIEWELDDAVFQESAGKEFMLEAIDVLKGVLAFEEHLLPGSPPPSEDEHEHVFTPAPPDPPATRPRSPSDPFLDTPPLSHSSTSCSPAIRSSTLLEPSEQATHSSLPQSFTRSRPTDKEPLDAEEDCLEGEPHIRMWTSADLDNPEFQSLISLFPDFIARHTLPRFPLVVRPRVPDLEDGRDITGEGKQISCGTGRMHVGAKQRRQGWKGSWWHRFTGWWRRLCC